MQKNLHRNYKIIAMIFIVTASGLFFTLTHTYNDAETMIVAQFNDQQRLIAKQTSLGIQKNMGYITEALKSLSQKATKAGMDLDEIRAAMELTYEQMRTLYVNDIGFLDAQGILRIPLRAPQISGKNFSFREYFQKARTMKSLIPVYEFIEFKGVDIGQKGIIIAMPVLDGRGEFAGIVLAAMKVNALLKGYLLSEPAGSEFWLIDSDNTVLFHPRYPYGSSIDKFLDIDASFKTFLNGIKKTAGYAGEYKSPEGTSTIAASYPINIADEKIFFVVSSPKDSVKNLLVHFNTNYITITLLSLLFIASALLFIIYSVQKWNTRLSSENALRKQAEQELRRHQEDLENMVQRRTAELQKEIEERKRAEEELSRHREHLQELIVEQTAELTRTNEQLQQEIIEHILAEEKKSQLFKEVESINQGLKDFAYIVSHDLKAPLRAISALANWISTDYKDRLDEEGQQQLGLMVKRVDRMHDLINGILEYSRVEWIKEKRIEVDINDLVKEVMEMIVPPESITVTVENELPTIVCEKTRIIEIFQNLLSNAVKFMDKPRGIIKISSAVDDGYWRFSISDNGPGIKEEYFDKIFQIFQTLSFAGEHESTGVGLTLIKKIITMYGGNIWVESEVGQGSTFFFTLPHDTDNASGPDKETKRIEQKM